MKEIKYTVKDPVGLHARPAGLLVKEAMAFQSKITISGNGKSADAKRLLSLMGLGIRQGMEIECVITGEDEEAAYHALLGFMEKNL